VMVSSPQILSCYQSKLTAFSKECVSEKPVTTLSGEVNGTIGWYNYKQSRWMYTRGSEKGYIVDQSQAQKLCEQNNMILHDFEREYKQRVYAVTDVNPSVLSLSPNQINKEVITSVYCIRQSDLVWK